MVQMPFAPVVVVKVWSSPFPKTPSAPPQVAVIVAPAIPAPEIAESHAPLPIRNGVSNGPGQERVVPPGAAGPAPERTEAAAANTS